MRHALSNHRSSLNTIATWAMFSRGLEPEFPSAVQQQVARLKQAARESGSDIRDLTALPWCSIDNDDSRDLDQLSVAQPDASGRVKILIAIADVASRVAKVGAPISTRGGSFHMASSKAGVPAPAPAAEELSFSMHLPPVGNWKEALFELPRSDERGH